MAARESDRAAREARAHGTRARHSREPEPVQKDHTHILGLGLQCVNLGARWAALTAAWTNKRHDYRRQKEFKKE